MKEGKIKKISMDNDLYAGKKLSFAFLAQRMAIGLICLIFALFLFLMGIMDITRLEKLLNEQIKNTALVILNEINQEVQNNFKYMEHVLGNRFSPVYNFSDESEKIILQESFLMSLIDLGRNLEEQYDNFKYNPHAFETLIMENGLLFFAIIDQKNRIIYQNRPIPAPLLIKALPVIKGINDLSIKLFSEGMNPAGIRHLVLRREKRNGAVILGFDYNGLFNRAAITCIKKVIEDRGLNEDIEYIQIFNRQGDMIAGTGRERSWREDIKQDIIEGLFLGGKSFLKDERLNGGWHIMEIASLLSFKNSFKGIIRIGMTTEKTHALVVKNRMHMFISLGLLISIGLLAIWFLYRNQNNHMARMGALKDKLLKAERLSALGNLSAGVAHEIRNPLNAISMAAQRLGREYLPKDEKERSGFIDFIRLIRDEINCLNIIVEDFLSFSRHKKPVFSPYPITELLDRTIRLIRQEVALKHIEIINETGDDKIYVLMDQGRLRQAFLNLFKNAVESIEGDGRITVTSDMIGRDKVSIQIMDTGAGIPADKLDTIYDPGYTTKQRGIGLGLPLAYEFINAHGGEINVKSRPGKGTVFEIILPVYRGSE